MKRCNVCGKLTKTQEMVWKGSKSILREVCINPKCKSYESYVLYKWKK